MTKAATIGDNADVAGIIKRWLNILSEVDKLHEDLKELKAEAKTKGFSKDDMKAMTLAIKEHRKAIEPQIKQCTNKFFADSGGQYTIFAD